MRKFFNTTGPCIQGKHYMIDPLTRFNSIARLIEEERYFILHAPRQTGKTTTLLHYVKKIQEQQQFIALYVNIEAAQPLRHDVESVNNVIVNAIARHAELQLPPEYQIPQELLSTQARHDKVYQVVSRWCSSLPKPVILFIDEADSLIGDGLISLLRQLRAGYLHRPNAFPQSLGLIGVRDIRDYRITSSTGEIISGGSAFNIKDESLTLRNFLYNEVVDLYQQHTKATGQHFTEQALQLIYDKTQGQPWLVNALGKQLVQGDSPIVPTETVEYNHVEIAIEQLILRRDVHLDQLTDKLSEPRVMPIIQSILIGETNSAEEFSIEELQYVVDLGLIRKGLSGW